MAASFSVIVPIYNVEPYLRQCLDSILAQTFSDFELLLIDDGSPDSCCAICDEYAAKDRRITVLHRENTGVVAARKAGLDIASGEYVCFVDGDDYVAPDWLETLSRCAGENGHPDMLIAGVTEIEGDAARPQPLRLAPGLYDRVRLEAEVFPYMLYDRRRPFFDQLLPGYLHTKAGRRELYLAHYLTDTRIKLYEDVAMIYECMVHASSIAFLAACPYYYRIRPDSAVGRYKSDHFRQNLLCLDYLRAHLGGCTPEIDAQIDAFIAAKAIRAVVYEFSHGHSYGEALAHVRTELRATGLMKDVRLSVLPIRTRIYAALLRYGLYAPAVLIPKVMGWR